jgi:hypothetical protein
MTPTSWCASSRPSSRARRRKIIPDDATLADAYRRAHEACVVQIDSWWRDPQELTAIEVPSISARIETASTDPPCPGMPSSPAS